MLDRLKTWTALALSLVSVAGAAHALYRESPAAACSPALISPIAPEDTREIRIPAEPDNEEFDRPIPPAVLRV